MSSSAAACTATVRQILDTAMQVEHLAITFYYAGLTNPAIAGAAQQGRLNHLAYLRSALAEEQKHAQLLQHAGGRAVPRAFYFPANTFTQLGFTSRTGLFLGVLDYLETVQISTYLAAIERLGALGQVDLAVLCVRILGTECTHRALGRAISGDDPADNITLEVNAFACAPQAAQTIEPFLSGRGFQNGPTPPIPLPTPAQVAGVLNRR